MRNPEKTREASKQWRLRNLEKDRATHRLWAAKNPDKMNEYRRQWRENNLERARELARRRYHANANGEKTQSRDWHRNNREQSRRNRFRRLYGISIEQRAWLLESQDGLCAICYERSATVVDHDHDTGQVRGMLCTACNRGMGLLRDNSHLLRLAWVYLREADLEPLEIPEVLSEA